MTLHRARKRFGQHFLTDKRTLQRLIEVIAPTPTDTILEIGPGRGALTARLLESVSHLHAVEIDRDLARELREKYPAQKLTVHCADALRFDFSSIGKELRIVGNLPYNISTELLFRLAAHSRVLKDIHVMLQKEVVERITALPSSKNYGRLSVMLQQRFDAIRLFHVPASAFSPAPQVESAVIVLTPRGDAPAADDAAFTRVVTAAFCQRRKKLVNSLAAYLGEADLRQLDIDPDTRAENLTGSEYARIANFVAQQSR